MTRIIFATLALALLGLVVLLARAPKRAADVPATTAPAISATHPTPASEQAMMNRLRTATDKSKPQATLELVREIERRFPDGAQAEERSFRAIEALSALDRLPEMREAAREHLAKWPRTQIAGFVAAYLSGPPEPSPPPRYR